MNLFSYPIIFCIFSLTLNSAIENGGLVNTGFTGDDDPPGYKVVDEKKDKKKKKAKGKEEDLSIPKEEDEEEAEEEKKKKKKDKKEKKKKKDKDKDSDEQKIVSSPEAED